MRIISAVEKNSTEIEFDWHFRCEAIKKIELKNKIKASCESTILIWRGFSYRMESFPPGISSNEWN